MGYERYPRGGDRYESRDDATDYGRSRDDRYGDAAARDYGAGGGGYGNNWSVGAGSGWGGDAGRRDERYGYGREPSRFTGGSDYYRGDQSYGRDPSFGPRDHGRDTYRQQRGTFDRRPQAYRDEDRGFFERAGDEVRSWFGDEDAERRREADARRDEAAARGNYGRDDHYRSWRDSQVAAFDRDYNEYRRENQSRFHDEFSSWRTDRQGQRDLLGRVEEHADVVGSDGAHVGTVDKVRGDRIILTKSDADAGGRHHSVPSNWLQSVDAGKVTLRKTAAEAQAHWRDEERSGALFEDGRASGRNADGSTNLNRSFSGTY